MTERCHHWLVKALWMILRTRLHHNLRLILKHVLRWLLLSRMERCRSLYQGPARYLGLLLLRLLKQSYVLLNQMIVWQVHLDLAWRDLALRMWFILLLLLGLIHHVSSLHVLLCRGLIWRSDLLLWNVAILVRGLHNVQVDCHLHS